MLHLKYPTFWAESEFFRLCCRNVQHCGVVKQNKSEWNQGMKSAEEPFFYHVVWLFTTYVPCFCLFVRSFLDNGVHGCWRSRLRPIRKAWRRPSPFQVSWNWRLQTYQLFANFHPPAEWVARVWLTKELGAFSESWASDENQCSRPSWGTLLFKSRVLSIHSLYSGVTMRSV